MQSHLGAGEFDDAYLSSLAAACCTAGQMAVLTLTRAVAVGITGTTGTRTVMRMVTPTVTRVVCAKPTILGIATQENRWFWLLEFGCQSFRVLRTLLGLCVTWSVAPFLMLFLHRHGAAIGNGHLLRLWNWTMLHLGFRRWIHSPQWTETAILETPRTHQESNVGQVPIPTIADIYESVQGANDGEASRPDPETSESQAMVSATREVKADGDPVQTRQAIAAKRFRAPDTIVVEQTLSHLIVRLLGYNGFIETHNQVYVQPALASFIKMALCAFYGWKLRVAAQDII